MNNEELPPFDPFFSILRISNTLEKNYNDFQNLVNSVLTTEQSVAKLGMDTKPPTGAENYSYFKASGRITSCNISQISSSGITINVLFLH